MLVVNPRNELTITSLPMGDGSADGSACEPSPPAVDTQFLGATTLDNPLASGEDFTAFAIRIEKGTRLLAESTI